MINKKDLAATMREFNWCDEADTLISTGVLPLNFGREVGSAISAFMTDQVGRGHEERENDQEIGRRIGKLRGMVASYNIEQRDKNADEACSIESGAGCMPCLGDEKAIGVTDD